MGPEGTFSAHGEVELRNQSHRPPGQLHFNSTSLNSVFPPRTSVTLFFKDFNTWKLYLFSLQLLTLVEPLCSSRNICLSWLSDTTFSSFFFLYFFGHFLSLRHSLALPGPWMLVFPVFSSCAIISESFHPLWGFKLWKFPLISGVQLFY